MTTDTHGWIDTGTIELPASSFAFNDGYPSPDAASGLLDTRTLNRALEVYLEQMPAVSVYAIRRGLRDFGATTAQHVVIWESRMDATTLLLTGNTETVYGMNFLDLQADGPTVVDVPAGMLGGFSDMWQRNVADIGKTGVDQGQGGKVLILPPGSNIEVPTGYLPAQSPTFGVWLGLRGMLVDGKSDQAVSLFKQIRIYPLSEVDNLPPMTFLNGSGQAIDTIFPDTAQFFADLAQLVQEEPAAFLSSQERFSLASIGIVRGTPFAPNAEQQATLVEAARVGSAIARANTFASRDPERIVYPDRRWEWLFIGGSATWDAQGYVNVDRRAGFAYAAIGMSPAMANRVVGAGSQYIWTPRDGSGHFLDGGRSYRLHLPPDIPVGAFWSVVVYARRQPLHAPERPTLSQCQPVHRSRDQRRRLSRRLLRSGSAGGPRAQLDQDRTGPGLVHHRPLLQPAAILLRPNLEAGRRHAGDLNCTPGFARPSQRVMARNGENRRGPATGADPLRWRDTSARARQAV